MIFSGVEQIWSFCASLQDLHRRRAAPHAPPIRAGELVLPGLGELPGWARVARPGAASRQSGCRVAGGYSFGACSLFMPGAGYRLGSDRGSPNQGSTLASKRVMAQIRLPARVST